MRNNKYLKPCVGCYPLLKQAGEVCPLVDQERDPESEGQTNSCLKRSVLWLEDFIVPLYKLDEISINTVPVILLGVRALHTLVAAKEVS